MGGVEALRLPRGRARPRGPPPLTALEGPAESTVLSNLEGWLQCLRFGGKEHTGVAQSPRRAGTLESLLCSQKGAALDTPRGLKSIY